MSSIQHWISNHEELWLWAGGISGLLFIVSLALLPSIAASIPVDYFCATPEKSTQKNVRLSRIVFSILKNVVGILLVLLGIIMLFVPGQGLLTIVIGIMLMSFPGKRKLEVWLIRREKIYALVNWLRAKRAKPPITKP